MKAIKMKNQYGGYTIIVPCKEIGEDVEKCCEAAIKRGDEVIDI